LRTVHARRTEGATIVQERDIEVPMRDGVVLRADVYRPDGDAPVPAVLSRTPYDKSFSLTPPAGIDPDVAVAAGLAYVCQDVRGQFGSDGDFYPLRAEGEDGYDTVAWIAEQQWCSGEVHMVGRSYAAAAQWLTAALQPPQLGRLCPVVIGCDHYDGWVYQGGAFQLGFNFFWAQMLSGVRVRGSMAEPFRHLPLTEPPLLDERSERFYRDWLAHPTRDEYWGEASIDGRHGLVRTPAFIVGGWYDLFLAGTLQNFRAMRDGAGSEEARSATRLLIGPYAHGSTYGQYPDHAFDEFAGADKIDLAARQVAFLKGELDGEAPVRIFVMGRNEWRDEADWPLARAREQPWYLRAGGGLSLEAPAEEDPDRYTYDPGNPAPTLGGPTSLPAPFMRTNSGPMDQRKIEERDDVLVYTSEPLSEPLEVTGPLSVVLHAASSARDTDFVAKLCDVAPDGSSRIRAEGVIRARYRGGFEHAELIEPDVVYPYRIDLVATSNEFQRGHRIRVSITSSSFPRFDRNTNTGNPLGADGPDDLVAAHQVVFHDADRASHIVLPVVRERCRI
jgi:putative CocE/NonD family hydrolase